MQDKQCNVLSRLEQLPAPREVENVTRDNFAEKVTSRYEPAVLKGFANQWEAVKIAKRSDRDIAQYLMGFDGGKKQNLVRLPASESGRLFYNESTQGVNFKVSDSSFTEGVKRMLESSHSPAEPSYCLQGVNVKEHLPGLFDALPNPLLQQGTQRFIWLGNKVTVAPHFDEAHNIAVVVAGKRRFTLFPPDQIGNLYIGPLEFTPAGQPISMVNLRDPDVIKFPNYEQAFRKALSIELDPGDAIYIPSPWWHHVESISPFNVLINYWWSEVYSSTAVPFPALMHAIQAFKNLPVEQNQAWKRIFDHYVFDPSSQPEAHIPIEGRGMLGGLTPEMSSQLHKWIVSQLR